MPELLGGAPNKTRVRETSLSLEMSKGGQSENAAKKRRTSVGVGVVKTQNNSQAGERPPQQPFKKGVATGESHSGQQLRVEKKGKEYTAGQQEQTKGGTGKRQNPVGPKKKREHDWR